MNSKISSLLCCCTWLLVSAAAEGNAAGVDAGASINTAPALTGCLHDDNAPFSSSASGAKGIDVEVAHMIAQKLGRELRIVWVQVPGRGGFGKALKESIQSGKCDFFAGIPSGKEMAAELKERKLVSTVPYLTVGYMLISPSGSKPATLSDAKRARRIGVATATPGDLFLHKENLNRIPYGNNRDLLAALRHGELDMALVWTPAIAADQMSQPGTALVSAVEQPNDPGLRTGLAIATRASDAALMREIDSALKQLQAERSVASLAERYGLPYFVPN